MKTSPRRTPSFIVVRTQRRRHVTGPVAARKAQAPTDDLSTLILYGQG
jgi:hypothetical protein